MGRTPFALTYVTYEEGDVLGWVCALLAMAPVFIMVAYATLLARNREAHVAYALVGQLANWRLNGALKRRVDAPRPDGCELATPGMPSDHGQFVGFWAAYVCLFLARLVPAVGPRGARAALGAGAAALAAAVAASRVYLGYHFACQVVAGLGVGAGAGAAWYALYETAVRPRLGAAVRASRVCRFFLVRDGAHLRDVLAAEYAALAPRRRP